MRTLAIRLAAAALFALPLPPAVAQLAPGQIPEIPAFLPMASAVPKTEASPIDGTWTVTSIGRLHFAQGDYPRARESLQRAIDIMTANGEAASGGRTGT
jgi:hypothetical protein